MSKEQKIGWALQLFTPSNKIIYKAIMKIMRAIISKRWAYITLLILACIIFSNIWLTYQIKKGVRELAEKLKKEDVSETNVFYRIGPATANAIKSVTKDDYSVSVWPFDCGMWESLSVTHTAFVKSEKMEIALRLRLSLFDGCFHVVGFYTVRYPVKPVTQSADT